MAVVIRKKPSDVVWSDLDQRFLTDGQGNIKIVKNVDAVITSIDNIMGTFLGERVMLPQFASRLKDLVFDPIDQDMMGFLAREVRDIIEAWDDRVKVVAINTSADPDAATVYMSIEFAVKSFQGTFTYNTAIK